MTTPSLPGTLTDAQVASYTASWAALIRISQLNQCTSQGAKS